MPFKFSKPKPWKVYGAVDSNLIIAGHSHSFALFMSAMKEDRFSNSVGVVAEADLKPHVSGNNSPREDDYWDFVRLKSKNKIICISWNGNQHNINFLIETPETFKIHGIYVEHPDAPAIPIDQLRSLFNPTFLKLRNLIEKLKDTSKIIILGTPPPKSKKYIDSLLKTDDFFKQLALESGIPIKFVETSSDELRIAMWKYIQLELEKIAVENDCIFVPIPPIAIENTGLLASKYWSDDITHANEDFGALLLDEILKSTEAIDV